MRDPLVLFIIGALCLGAGGYFLSGTTGGGEWTVARFLRLAAGFLLVVAAVICFILVAVIKGWIG